MLKFKGVTKHRARNPELNCHHNCSLCASTCDKQGKYSDKSTLPPKNLPAVVAIIPTPPQPKPEE